MYSKHMDACIVNTVCITLTKDSLKVNKALDVADGVYSGGEVSSANHKLKMIIGNQQLGGREWSEMHYFLSFPFHI